MILKKYILPLAIFTVASLAFSSCADPSAPEKPLDADFGAAAGVKTDSVSFKSDSTTMLGYVAFDSARHGKLPIVLVVPEWWGVNDYTKSRARQVAALGYLAMTVDIYGNGKEALDPETAGKLASAFYKDPALAKARLEAALAKAKTLPQADTTKTAAIGYCFGGSVVLNSAKLGSKLNGVVSFHGGLAGVAPDTAVFKSKILVLHGKADSFVPEAEIAQFRKSLDSVDANYKFIAYDSATHAFTNPGATEKGKKFNMPIKYNAAADKKSWEDMTKFLADLFK